MSEPEAYVICRFDEIPSRQGRGFLLARRDDAGGEQSWPVFIVRWGRHVFAYENRCPHRGTRLDWEKDQFMDGSGERLICGKHGALFELDTGLCIDGPCAGAALTSISVSVEEDDICLLGVDLVDSDEA
jgi:nitrite reductase/ring-hydroxylating ferredoxin subunit